MRGGAVPVYSLYSETREPTAEMLEAVDVLVVDLQDVGTRVYTYIYTMANCMRAAARHGIPVVVCDRPNPVGGTEIEGSRLDPAYASFVGQFPIPLRHGMTIGELARMFNEDFGINCSLDVVPLAGWRRSMYFDETGMPWVMPSPNLPTLDSTIVYPGAVLIEGTVSPKDAARRGRSSYRRAVDRRRTAGRRDERATAAGRSLPCRRSSNRHFKSTRSRRAAAVSCTCSIEKPSGRSERRSN